MSIFVDYNSLETKLMIEWKFSDEIDCLFEEK